MYFMLTCMNKILIFYKTFYRYNPFQVEVNYSGGRDSKYFSGMRPVQRDLGWCIQYSFHNRSIAQDLSQSRLGDTIIAKNDNNKYIITTRPNGPISSGRECQGRGQVRVKVRLGSGLVKGGTDGHLTEYHFFWKTNQPTDRPTVRVRHRSSMPELKN